MCMFSIKSLLNLMSGKCIFISVSAFEGQNYTKFVKDTKTQKHVYYFIIRNSINLFQIKHNIFFSKVMYLFSGVELSIPT